ncbi:MAG: hypothetical protein ACOX8E_06220 [Ruminococcus sp.]|jgi:hypothetical protein
MDIRFILTLVMGVLLMTWIVFCGISFIRHARIVTADAGFVARVRCEKCKTQYEVSAEDFSKSLVSKFRSVTRTKLTNGMFISRPRFSYYAKKFCCPCCKKKRYAEVLNINEINDSMLKPSLKAGIRWLVIMCIGGAVILIATGIPMYFAQRAAQERVKDLKEQQYEELINRYFNEE